MQAKKWHRKNASSTTLQPALRLLVTKSKMTSKSSQTQESRSTRTSESDDRAKTETTSSGSWARSTDLKILPSWPKKNSTRSVATQSSCSFSWTRRSRLDPSPARSTTVGTDSLMPYRATNKKSAKWVWQGATEASYLLCRSSAQEELKVLHHRRASGNGDSLLSCPEVNNGITLTTLKLILSKKWTTMNTRNSSQLD